jgi:hypothetical protein
MNRKLAKARLFLRLNRLARFCKAQDTPWPGTIWPDQVFLRSLEAEVVFLIITERKKRPSPAWKAFQLLNKRMPSLQLVLRINNLVKRARDRLEEAASTPAKQTRTASRMRRRECAKIAQRHCSNQGLPRRCEKDKLG